MVEGHISRHGFWARSVGLAAVTGACGLLLNATAAGAGGIPVTVTSHFQVTTTSSVTAQGDVMGNEELLGNGAVHGNPGSILFVSHVLSPGGACGCTGDPAPTGVMFDTNFNTWAIYNQDGSAMPVGTAFNVLAVPTSSAGVFVHTATAQNTGGQETWIDSPLTNNNPKAQLQITADYNPGGSSTGVNDPHVVGAYYDTISGLWMILNEDGASMPVGASFNVMVGAAYSNGGKQSVLTLSSSNAIGSENNALGGATVGNPNAIVFTTADADFNGRHKVVFDPAPVSTGWFDFGSFYADTIFHEDNSNMLLGEQFNVLTFSS